MLESSTLWLTCVLTGLDLAGVALVIPFMPLLATSLDISKSSYGILMSLYNVTQFGSGFLLGNIIDRWSKRTLWIISACGCIFSYGLIGVATQYWHLVISRLTVGMVKQTSTITSAIISQNTSREERSKWVARLSAFTRGSFILAMSGAGFINDFGWNLPLLSVCVYIIVLSCLIFLFPKNIPTNIKKKETLNEIAEPTELQTLTSNLDSTTEDNIKDSSCDVVLKSYQPYKEVLQDIFSSAPFVRLFFIHVLTSFVTVGFRNMKHMYMISRYDLDMKGISKLGAVTGGMTVVINGFIIPLTKNYRSSSVILASLIGLSLCAAAEYFITD
eukprot:UN24272